MTTFGDLIKKRRSEKEWSVVEVAQKAGISRSYLWDLEQGARSPSGSVVRSIAYALELEPDELARTAGQLSERATSWLALCPDAIELIEEMAANSVTPALTRQLIAKVKRWRR